MKRKERRTFTPQQRLEIVLEGLQDGASVSQVCRRHVRSKGGGASPCSRSRTDRVPLVGLL